MKSIPFRGPMEPRSTEEKRQAFSRMFDPKEDKTRQEDRDAADVRKVLAAHVARGEPIAPVSGFGRQDMSIDMADHLIFLREQQAELARRDAEAAAKREADFMAALPESVRESYEDSAAVLAALHAGELKPQDLAAAVAASSGGSASDSAPGDGSDADAAS